MKLNLTKRQQEEVVKALQVVIRHAHIGLEPMINHKILERVCYKIIK